MFRQSYTNQTMIGNWYDDRFDEESYTLPKWKLRTVYNAKTPLKMDTPVEMPFTSINNSTYSWPVRHQAVSYPMSDSSTEGRTKERRVRAQPVWEGPFPPYESRNARNYETTYSQAVEGAYPGQPESGIKGRGPYWDNKTLRPVSAGRRREQAGITAQGEMFKVDDAHDPKHHTFVQRSWQYNRDLHKDFADFSATKNKFGGARHTRPVSDPLKTGHQEEKPRSSFARQNDSLKATGPWGGWNNTSVLK